MRVIFDELVSNPIGTMTGIDQITINGNDVVSCKYCGPAGETTYHRVRDLKKYHASVGSDWILCPITNQRLMESGDAEQT